MLEMLGVSKWVVVRSCLACLLLSGMAAWCAPVANGSTIQVTKAKYLADKDVVVVFATSDLNAEAALSVEITGIGKRRMKWKDAAGRWQKRIGNATDKGFDAANSATALVKGSEGEILASIKTTGTGGGDSGPHAGLTYDAYPGNCLSCHADQADEMMQTTHYQWMGEAPDMVNGPGQRQGKLTNAVNSYCINIQGNWPVCGSCHVGRGQRPDEAGNNLENIDCLMCHNDAYAAQRTRLPDGSMGVAQPADSMVQDVHRPTRANCLACHATAGGGDGVKRGDLSRATITNADSGFDVHMNSAGSNLECQSCHVFENHKVIGKGSDLRPTDDLARGSEISCLTCHTDKNSPGGHDTVKINDHVARVACQTCHIPVYAKVATETYRDWRTHHDGSPADTSAVPGHPYTEKIANLTPSYRFWDRNSDNALLGDDASRTYNGDTDTWPTSTPLGSVASGKLYPFKYKTAMQPKTRADHRLIALNTFEYLKGTGNVNTAIQQGLTAMGYPANEPYDWVLTDTYQQLNHGISPAADALQCADCHGSTGRIDLQGDLGYQLKGSQSSVCTQCHGSEDNEGFTKIHDKHVKDKKYDCSRCHTFSRPER